MNVYHAARTAGWSRRRLFGIFRPSFSRHITQVSAVRYLPPFVQSTHHAGVGCSVSSALLSADISRRRRLFGIFRSSFSRHITQVSAVHSLGYSICNSRFLQPDIPASKPYTRDLYLPCHTNPPNVLLSVFHLERAYGNPKCCC